MFQTGPQTWPQTGLRPQTIPQRVVNTEDWSPFKSKYDMLLRTLKHGNLRHPIVSIKYHESWCSMYTPLYKKLKIHDFLKPE